MALEQQSMDAPGTARPAPRMHFVEQTTSVAKSLTVIVGVIIALLQLNTGLKEATQTLNAVKLQALQQLTGLLDTD